MLLVWGFERLLEHESCMWEGHDLRVCSSKPRNNGSILQYSCNESINGV
jgi:hypothetical protein